MITADAPATLLVQQQSAFVVHAEARATLVIEDDRTPLVVSSSEGAAVQQVVEQTAVQMAPDAAPIVIAAGDQGPPGRDGTSGSAERVTVTYASFFVSEQIVYLEAGRAYPVTRDMPQAVTKLLAQIIDSGPANAVREVIVQGAASSQNNALPAGLVLLGDDGFPAGSAYVESGNYVPLGYSAGGPSFNFAPAGRYLRSM